MKESHKAVIALADGNLSSVEIGEKLGLRPRHVRKLLLKYNLPRLNCGGRLGDKHYNFQHGRNIDLDGYAMVSAIGHPSARRHTKAMAEHRLVAEKKIGRYLKPSEVVDHIDGLKLHNHPDNLRVFENNGAHLAATISGTPRNWSQKGYLNIGTRSDLGKTYQRVDTYRYHRKRGDVRLLEILRCAYALGIDSPYLLGTHRHLEKAGIDHSSRSKIERALADLSEKWGVVHAL